MSVRDHAITIFVFVLGCSGKKHSEHDWVKMEGLGKSTKDGSLAETFLRTSTQLNSHYKNRVRKACAFVCQGWQETPGSEVLS